MCQMRGEGSVDPRWRSGRSPATPDRLRDWIVPHYVPLCNTIVVGSPTKLERCEVYGSERPGLQEVCREAVGRCACVVAAGRVADRRVAARIAGFRGSAYDSWGRVGGRTASSTKGLARMLRRFLLLSPALVAAVVLSACGSGGAGSGGADPAAAVPRGVAFYAEVVLRPDGG